jgi:hypothetical protein
MEKNTLYIFIDESGDLNFSQKGTSHFILTAISTLNPLVGREAILGVRYGLLREGRDIEYFHASEDAQIVRDKVFETVKTLVDYDIDAVIAEKRKAGWSLHTESTASSNPLGDGFKFNSVNVVERFYKQICETLLQYIIYRYIKMKSSLEIDKIIVVMDQVLPRKKRGFVTKAIKTYIKDNFGLVPYMYFHSTKADINSQISDYCCWAIKKKWSDNEIRPYNEIKQNIKSEFDIFRHGTRYFY